MHRFSTLTIFTDGGSRGNPGISATGVYISDEHHERVHAFGNYIGITTNNVAEYTAVIEALDWVLAHKEDIDPKGQINFCMDSRLVVMQATGKFRVKNPNLQLLLAKIHTKESAIGIPITYTHIPREKNKEADKQVNIALDNL